MRLSHLFRPRDVIVSSLAGGLGNQLFQYAFGRAVALQHGCNLALDTRILAIKEGQTPRDYELGEFNVQAHVDSLTKAQLNRCIVVKESSWLDSSNAISAISSTVPGCRLTGYWQSEKYFNTIRQQLLADLTLRRPVSPYVESVAAQIRSSKAVSVHYRRGDYVSDPKVAAVHGTCEPDYQVRAIRALEAQLPGLHYFLFSDDPEWLRSNLPAGIQATIVDSDRSSAREDLWLMSLCQHHIIANSSFSWWGAWLSTQDGLTYAPSRWFLDPKLSDRDIIPDRWSRI